MPAFAPFDLYKPDPATRALLDRGHAARRAFIARLRECLEPAPGYAVLCSALPVQTPSYRTSVSARDWAGAVQVLRHLFEPVGLALVRVGRPRAHPGGRTLAVDRRCLAVRDHRLRGTGGRVLPFGVAGWAAYWATGDARDWAGMLERAQAEYGCTPLLDDTQARTILIRAQELRGLL